jgi:hypothetical protein
MTSIKFCVIFGAAVRSASRTACDFPTVDAVETLTKFRNASLYDLHVFAVAYRFSGSSDAFRWFV